MGMAVFDQLKFSDDGKHLFIDVHVDTAAYYDDVYLQSLTIVPADKILETSPDTVTSDYIYEYSFAAETKSGSFILDASDFVQSWDSKPFPPGEMQTTLFFVYVTCWGTPAPDVPCGCDTMTTLGITFYKKPFFQKAMNYTKELVKDCTIPTEFTDFILLWNGFKVSVETAHYITARDFYNRMFDVSEYSPQVRPCNCHN